MISGKEIIRAHVEWILTGAGIFLALLIGWILVWGVTIMARDLGSALATPKPQIAGDRFELEKAAKLDLRGLQAQ